MPQARHKSKIVSSVQDTPPYSRRFKQIERPGRLGYSDFFRHLVVIKSLALIYSLTHPLSATIRIFSLYLMNGRRTDSRTALRQVIMSSMERPLQSSKKMKSAQESRTSLLIELLDLMIAIGHHNIGRIQSIRYSRGDQDTV